MTSVSVYNHQGYIRLVYGGVSEERIPKNKYKLIYDGAGAVYMSSIGGNAYTIVSPNVNVGYIEDTVADVVHTVGATPFLVFKQINSFFYTRGSSGSSEPSTPTEPVGSYSTEYSNEYD